MSEQENIKQILSNLSVIGSIQKDQTFSISTMSIVDHNSWFTSAWRYYYGENREKTVDFIINIFHEAFKLCQNKPSKLIIEGITNSLVGIINLKETYKKDANIYLTIGDLIIWIELEIRNLYDLLSKNEEKIK